MRDVAPGHNITVFHNIDFVATFGHAAETLTVEVRRNGVLIGSSSGPTVVTPEGPGSRSTTVPKAPQWTATAGWATRRTSGLVTASA